MSVPLIARGPGISLPQLHSGQPIGPCSHIASKCFAADGGSARQKSPSLDCPGPRARGGMRLVCSPAYDMDRGLFGIDANAWSDSGHKLKGASRMAAASTSGRWRIQSRVGVGDIGAL
jgi:hypothetical protein